MILSHPAVTGVTTASPLGDAAADMSRAWRALPCTEVTAVNTRSSCPGLRLRPEGRGSSTRAAGRSEDWVTWAEKPASRPEVKSCAYVCRKCWRRIAQWGRGRETLAVCSEQVAQGYGQLMSWICESSSNWKTEATEQVDLLNLTFTQHGKDKRVFDIMASPELPSAAQRYGAARQ